MKRFDLVFETLSRMINEKEDYIQSAFSDNVRLMISKLKDSGYLSDQLSVEDYTKKTLSQPGEVKVIVLDTKDSSIPRIKVLLKQLGNQEEPSTEDFSVTVVPLDDPTKQKEFSNTMLETIFDDTAEYIKQIALKNLAPEAAVDELPVEQNPSNQQTGAEASALPGVKAPQTPPSR